MSGIKVLVVDGGGVLLTGVPTPMLVELAKRYPADKAAIETAHSRNSQPWTSIKLKKDYSEEQFWKDLLQGVNVKESAEELGTMLRESIKLYEDVYDICSRAKAKGVSPGILSNHATGWIDFVVKKFQLDKTFDKGMIVVSQEIGFDKPSTEIYEALYSKIKIHLGDQIQKGEIVFVDDKIQNVTAATNYGFKGVHFDHLKESGKDLEKKLADIGLNLA